MLGDEDVFESVAWETPSAGYHTADVPTSNGPGFKQSTDDSSSDATRGPNDPKWEGYLITSVQDPIKELAETKDAYVSYLVSAKVSSTSILFLNSALMYDGLRRTFLSSPVRPLQPVVAFKTSYSCANTCRKTFPHVLSPRCPRNIG